MPSICFIVGHHERMPIGEEDGIFGKTSTELRLQGGRNEIEVAAITKRLAGR